MSNNNKPVIVGKMEPSQFEYFGTEQNATDLQEIVADQTDPLRIVGKIQGDWFDDLDKAVNNATKELYGPRGDHSDYLYITRLSEVLLPTISKIPEVLGFKENYQAQIQMQRPGCCMVRHKDPSIGNRIKFLITLAPWEYGQYLFFNNTIFREWETGTIIHTDFSSVWHATTNTSWHTRPILSITGEPNKQLQDLLDGHETPVFQL
jgi:hypothetical protein